MEGVDFAHMTWTCAIIHAYWTEVFRHISVMVDHVINPCPRLVLLGYVKPLKQAIRRFTAMALLLAKRQISLNWGRSTRPTTRSWLTDLQTCNRASEDYATLLPVTSRPKDIWQPLKDYLQHFSIAEAAD